MTIPKDQLLEFIEDYAAAKSTGRALLIQVAASRLQGAVDQLFTKPEPQPKPEAAQEHPPAG